MTFTSLGIDELKRSATIPNKNDPVHKFKCQLVRDYLIPLCEYILTLDKYPHDKLPNEKIASAWNFIQNGISVQSIVKDIKTDLDHFVQLSAFSNTQIWKELLELSESEDKSRYKDYAVIVERRGNIMYKTILDFLKQQRMMNEVEFFYKHVYVGSDPTIWYTNWETLKNDATRIYPEKNDICCRIIRVLETIFELIDVRRHDPIYMI